MLGTAADRSGKVIDKNRENPYLNEAAWICNIFAWTSFFNLVVNNFCYSIIKLLQLCKYTTYRVKVFNKVSHKQ